jgi:hypothetical protein
MDIHLEIMGIDRPTASYQAAGSTVCEWSGTTRIAAVTEIGRIEFAVRFQNHPTLDAGVDAAMRTLAQICRSLGDEAERYATYHGIR